MITKEMTIGEVVNTHPEVIDTLMDCGLHCLGCPSSQAETLEEAAMVHGMVVEEFIRILNENVKK